MLADCCCCAERDAQEQGVPRSMIGLVMKTAPRRKRSAAITHEIPVHLDFDVQEASKRMRLAADGTKALALLVSPRAFCTPMLCCTRMQLMM